MELLIIFVVCIATVLAKEADKKVDNDKNQIKRGLFDISDYGGGHGLGSVFNSGGGDLPYLRGNDNHHVTTITITKKIPHSVPHPVPYTVVKHIPVPYKVPVKVPVNCPYPVHVPKPYPVTVEKPYPVTIKKPYPVSVKVLVKVPYPVPHPVYVPKPYPVHIPKPYPVKVTYTVVVEKKIPIYTKEYYDFGRHGLDFGEGHDLLGGFLGHNH